MTIGQSRNLHGLDKLSDAANVAFDCHSLTLKEIREAKAETLHGVAIKLAAIRRETDDEDYLEAMHDALSAADRILATDLPPCFLTCIGWKKTRKRPLDLATRAALK